MSVHALRPRSDARPDHGALGCCLTHDLVAERLADAADADRCDECHAHVPPGAGVRQEDDLATLLCALCDEDAREANAAAVRAEDEDWRRDR